MRRLQVSRGLRRAFCVHGGAFDVQVAVLGSTTNHTVTITTDDSITVTFTAIVANAGNTIAAASVVGTGLPGDPQTLTWSLALGNADIDISALGSVTIVYRATVLATVGSGQTLDNTVTVGFSSIDALLRSSWLTRRRCYHLD